MNRRDFLMRAAGAMAAATLAPGRAPGQSRQSSAKPNLIMFLADDMGYADPGCFGGRAVPTPNIDALATDGMRFTRFYSGSAVCTPTRASVLTGRYPLRFGIRKHFSDDEAHLPRGVTTLPALLQSAGYATAHIGKWHLGGLHLKHIRDRAASIPGPHEHGFDHYLCQNEEQPLRGEMGRERTLYRRGGTCLIRDEKRVGPDDPYYDGYLTDIIGAETIRLIDRFHRESKPFFLNVWWLTPHTPYEPAPEPQWSGTAATGISDDQHRFRSMVARLDYQIGKILARLDDLKIRDNTFILFPSDNGGAYEANIGPFKGGKTDLHEGGIRVPMIATWPAKIPAGTQSHALTHTNDIMPTFCVAAGAPLATSARCDGVNLLPHMTQREPAPERDTVFWQMDLYKHLQRHYPKPKPYSTEVARRGKWKLLALDGEPTELFDLEADPLEKTNLLERHPDIVNKLRAELTAWLAEPRLSRYGQ
jgi:N-acetylgalactosamine-6-sulfatase